MNGSAESGPGTPGRAVVEERLQRLEVQVEALMEAVGVLAHGLEGGPAAEKPRSKTTEEAARRAHEFLLLARSVSHQQP